MPQATPDALAKAVAVPPAEAAQFQPEPEDVGTTLEAESAVSKEKERQAKDYESALAAFVRRQFEQNKQARLDAGIDDAMLASELQAAGVYSEGKLAEIQEQGGSEVYLNRTGVKCRGCLYWVQDVLRASGKRHWGCRPTPLPDTNDELEKAIADHVTLMMVDRFAQTGQEPNPHLAFQMAAEMRDKLDELMQADATQRARKMEEKIADQMAQGGWEEAFNDFLMYAIWNKAGILKGPVVTKKPVLQWGQKTGAKPSISVKNVMREMFFAPSPFDIYPQKGAKSCQEGNLCEKVRFTRRQLYDMRGVPGWNTDAIDLILSEYAEGGLLESAYTDETRAELEMESPTDGNKTSEKIDGIEMWGSVPGSVLLAEGITKTGKKGEKIRPLKEYEVLVDVVGEFVLYYSFNRDPWGERPYSHTGFARQPGSFWYWSLPELMTDIQDICNSSARNIVNNEALAGGPQQIIHDINRLVPGQDIRKVIPFGVWVGKGIPVGGLPLVSFEHIPSHVQEFLAIETTYAREADDVTGVPAYQITGSDKVGGPGGTVGGFRMLMQNSTRALKGFIAQIDAATREVIRRLYRQNMLYIDDDSIKGDMDVVPVGTLAMIVREGIAATTMDWLRATANPTDLQIIGAERRAAQLREAGSAALDVDPDKIAPSEEEMREKAERQAQVAAAMAQAQAGATATPGPGASKREAGSELNLPAEEMMV